MSKENRNLPMEYWLKDATEKSKNPAFYMIGHIAAEVGEVFNALQKGDTASALDEIKDAIRGLEILEEYLTHSSGD
jgi:NTP pyrophosphatase (non-canonical NTP hydrolase)